MPTQPNSNELAHFDANNNYTYPQFVIDEKTGKVEVNFIDWASGRVVRHIPATELNEIIRDHGLNSGMHSP